MWTALQVVAQALGADVVVEGVQVFLVPKGSSRRSDALLHLPTLPMPAAHG